MSHPHTFARCSYCRREWQLSEWSCALHRMVCDYVECNAYAEDQP